MFEGAALVFLSIIIPCHNRLKLLSELVHSIPAREDIEVIVVDDCSTEDLSQIDLSAFLNHKFIRNNTASRFAGSARNIGIENSSGLYLFFADSDDLIISDGFLRCLEILAKEKPDVLFAKATSFFNQSKVLGKRHIRNNWLVDEVERGVDACVLARFVGPIAKFIRADFIEKHDLRFESQKVSNDIVFAALLVVNKPVMRVSGEVVYSIRQGNSALTSDCSIESTETRLHALLRYNKVLADNGLGYLMAPALPLLKRLIRKDPIKLTQWSAVFLTKRQPVLFTWWTLRNYLVRCLSKSV